MKQLFKVLLFIVTIIILTSNCARKGTPTGGSKDSLAPLMVTANPPYKSINFKKNKIKISFDEYITLKNITQQLVISPPLKYLPSISPQGTPSKDITIKITDTLQANTTYTFNFGNSIQDNNEGNQLKQFKYVFSTGAYIDSLKTRGIVKDAYEKKFDKNINVLLYKIDTAFTDSIIYKQKPNYITNTLDSILFNISNIQKGKYLLVALKDVSNNYIFNPKEDKIGIYQNFISLPQDSVLTNPIFLFKELPPFRLTTPKQLSKGKIIFGFEGEKEGLEISLLTKVSRDFKSITKFETHSDTLNYWHSAIKNDSLVFKIVHRKFMDTVTVFLRNKKVDSLKINSNITTTLNLKDTLTLISNNPVVKIDSTKITFLNSDSLQVPYTKIIEKQTNKIKFLFDKKYNSDYKLTLYPKAFTDIFQTQNDTLNYVFSTKEPEDFGGIALAVNKQVSAPVIIELLTSDKLKLMQRFTIYDSKTLNFDLLPPGKYTIRAIVDTNKNNRWDTGNYLQKQKPEKVIYHPTIFNVRSNWYLPIESLTIN